MGLSKNSDSRPSSFDHPKPGQFIADCQKCDLVAATVVGLKDQFDGFKSLVERQFDQQGDAMVRQEASSERRHEEMKRNVESLRDLISNSPAALMQRMVLVEEKNATLTRILAFVATATVTTLFTVIGSIVSGVVHLK